MPEAGRGIESLFVLAVVPEMNGVVVGRVIGGLGKDLLEDGIESNVAADGNTFAIELPAAANEEGFGLDVVRVVQDDVFVSAEEILDALFGILFLFVIVVGDFGVEIGAFVIGDFKIFFFEELASLGDKFLGAFLVRIVGLGESPIGHGAVGVVSEDFAKGTFGFVIPKTVKLAQALVEVGLALIP